MIEDFAGTSPLRIGKIVAIPKWRAAPTNAAPLEV